MKKYHVIKKGNREWAVMARETDINGLVREIEICGFMRRDDARTAARDHEAVYRAVTGRTEK